MTRSLYLPEKYRVWTGEGAVGLCTAWTDPEYLLREAPGILRKVGILGTLYSREGVNIILRNLALNPDIRQLFLLSGGALSRTPFGKMGLEIIRALWGRGFSADYAVSGTSFKLHPEFDLDVIRAVINNVQLEDISGDCNQVQAIAKSWLGSRGEKAYMKPQKFPEHKLGAGRGFPSETVGFVVRGEKITDAWTKVVDRIVRYGVIKETEYGNKQRELINVNWVVENESTLKPYFPHWPRELTKINGADGKSLDKYYPEFMTARLPKGTAYTYGQRLWRYGGRCNQIGKIIAHLRESPVTRRGVATTWDQYVDSDVQMKSPPCLVSIQAMQTNGQLHLLANFRSHDIFKAAIPNAFALRRLQEYISQRAGFDVGYLSITSASAHIYEEDWDNAIKLLKCSLWEREPDLVFREDADADPRGNILIRLQGKDIIAELVSPGGSPLLSFSGKTAREVYKKIAALDLLSRPDHYADIGAELQKAEIALKFELEYKQDRQLKIKSANQL